MPPSFFPLRWESTVEQWWYASPIDWAAANGLYDLVKELLRLDANLLIKLTSLSRIRRLESVWDDEAHFHDVAKCRSLVARNLLLDCEETDEKGNRNSLIRAGYGGWLLYTAASAGDAGFVQELLERDPLLVFGEGEYGVTDILYAAARSKNSHVFRLLLHSALSPTAELEENNAQVFKKDMMNRAIHAAARGGNWQTLKELLPMGSGSEDIVAYRDAQGSTVLHTAAGRGRVQVVRNLIASSSDVITSTDAQGNTALHVASYRGFLPVVEILILASPPLALLTNHCGDTFLHMAVAGFRSPGFHRLNKHMELMKRLVSGMILDIQDVINVRNNDGRTALHVAVIDNIQCDIVELLMSVPSIDINVCDVDGMTPLDLLKQRPKSASSEILIKQMISAGGISNSEDYIARKDAFFTQMKTNGIGSSPGTSFRIPDAEIFLYTGIENESYANYDQASVEPDSFSCELSNAESPSSPNNSRSSSINQAARRFKFLLQWPRRKETKTALEDDDSVPSCSSSKNLEDSKNFPMPLRQRYSKPCSLPSNKRTLSIRSNLPSASTKQKFTVDLTQGVIQLKPHLAVPVPAHSPPSPFPRSCLASINKQEGVDSNGSTDEGAFLLTCTQGSFNRKFIKQCLSFGAQGLSVVGSNSCTGSNQSYKYLSSLVA